MAIYICATMISVFFSALTIIKSRNIREKSNYAVEVRKINYLCAFFSFLPLYLVSAFRYDVGQDYFYTYVPLFNSVANTGTYKSVEKGYILLNKLVLLFTSNYAGIFILTSFILCFFIFKCIFEQSKMPVISSYIFVTSTFYFISMNLVRQAITIAIFFYSIKYIKDRNFKRYLFMILIAASIHVTALIYIPVYFIANKSIKFKNFIITYISLFIGLPLTKDFIYFIISKTKYAYYIGSVYDNGERVSVSPLISLSIVLLTYFYIRKTKKKDFYDNIYLNIQIIATLSSTALGIFPLALRIFIDFEYIQILLVASIIKMEKNKFNRMVLIAAIIILYGLYFYYTIGIKNGSNVLPYKTIFNI